MNYDAWKLDSPEYIDLELTKEDLEEYYNKNQDYIELLWEEHVISNDWGSGEDKIQITDEIFWEWLEEIALKDTQYLEGLWSL